MLKVGGGASRIRIRSPQGRARAGEGCVRGTNPWPECRGRVALSGSTSLMPVGWGWFRA